MFCVCPLCNGMISQDITCPNCLNPTIECGKRNDYVGPYTPYTGDNSEEPNQATGSDHAATTNPNSTQAQCWHMAYCEACHIIIWIDGYQLYTNL